jgi:copper(I)-binding protein
LAAAVFALLAGSPTLAAEANVTVENPWVRFIIKARPAAGYFTLRNDGDTATKLTGASSSACGMLMMHRSTNENGVDKMLPVKSVPVPAHGSVSFAPGNYHLMCMSPSNAMALGANVPVTLKFADGQSVTAQFPVKGAGGK